MSLSCVVAAAAVATAPPALKPGMWEIRMQHAEAGGATMPPSTVKRCREASEIAKSQATADEFAKKNCSKNETHQSGTRWVTEMVCKVGTRTMTTHSVTDMATNTAYHTEMTSTFTPQSADDRASTTTMDGKWLAPCSPQ